MRKMSLPTRFAPLYDALIANAIRLFTQQMRRRFWSLIGFGTAATLRHHFRETLGTTPTSYRRLFQSTSNQA